MSSASDGSVASGQAGGTGTGSGTGGNAGAGVVGGVYAVERLLAAVLLTTSGPGALSQWLAMAAAVYFLAGLLAFVWRVRWLVILAVRVARGMPGPRARRRALATFAARPPTGPGQQNQPDVLVAASLRSGGTWASHIAHQLRMRGSPPDFFWQEDVVPWIDLHQDLFELPAQQHPQPCLPRIFRTTATWCDLEHAGVLRSKQGGELVGGDCKVIYVFRDICDVCYSLFFYFPALFQVDSVLIHLEDFVFCARFLLLERSLWSLVHFWRRRDDPSILFLFFDELFSDSDKESGAIRRIADFMGAGSVSEELIETVGGQTSHECMSSDDNWDRFSGMSVAVLVSERLGLGYRYELEPYLGKVSRIGGKPGQGRRVLGEAARELFDAKWRQIVTEELGFKDLAEMQAARREELASRRRQRSADNAKPAGPAARSTPNSAQRNGVGATPAGGGSGGGTAGGGKGKSKK